MTNVQAHAGLNLPAAESATALRAQFELLFGFRST